MPERNLNCDDSEDRSKDNSYSDRCVLPSLIAFESEEIDLGPVCS